MHTRSLTFLRQFAFLTAMSVLTSFAFAQDVVEKPSCEKTQLIRRATSTPAPKPVGVVNQEVQVFCGAKDVGVVPPQVKTVESLKEKEGAVFDYSKLIEAISKLLASIAWPVAAVFIAYFFREELRKLFERLESLKYKDAEAKFNQQLKEAEKAAEPVKQRVPEGWEKATGREMFTQHEQFQRIAEVSPRAAILEAWIDVEVAIYAAARKAGLEVKGPSNAYSLARNLVSLGKIPEDILPFFDQLRRLRNNAAHLPDFVLNESEANKYLDLSLGLANTFREYAVESAG